MIQNTSIIIISHILLPSGGRVPAVRIGRPLRNRAGGASDLGVPVQIGESTLILTCKYKYYSTYASCSLTLTQRHFSCTVPIYSMAQTDSLPQTLTGKVTVVTGSSRGLGRCMALDLAKRGAKVVVTYTSESSKVKVDDLIAEIENIENTSTAISVRADLNDLDSPSTIIKRTVDAFGGIDILVNNAGIELGKRLEDITPDDFSTVYNINVRAPVLLTQAAIPHLHPNSRIINISSVAARCGFPAFSLYCASKAALEGLTRCWAAELGHNGTTVNAVAPGPVQSDMLDNIPDEIKNTQRDSTPIQKRFGTQEEVAAIVSWLASPEASWTTGQTISASGGWSMY